MILQAAPAPPLVHTAPAAKGRRRGAGPPRQRRRRSARSLARALRGSWRATRSSAGASLDRNGTPGTLRRHHCTAVTRKGYSHRTRPYIRSHVPAFSMRLGMEGITNPIPIPKRHRPNDPNPNRTQDLPLHPLPPFPYIPYDTLKPRQGHRGETQEQLSAPDDQGHAGLSQGIHKVASPVVLR